MTYYHQLSVRFADTDANGHVFFANYLTFFDQAFVHYLKAIGFGYRQFVQRGLNFFYAEALTRFKSGAVFDQLLDIYPAISRLARTSFTTEFEIYDHASGAFVNSGYIVSVVVDMKTEKPHPIPEAFRQAVSAFHTQG